MSLAVKHNRNYAKYWLQIASSICQRDWITAAMLMDESQVHRSMMGRACRRMVARGLVGDAQDDWKARKNYFGAWNKFTLAEQIIPDRWESWLRTTRNELIEYAVAEADEQLKRGQVDDTLAILRGLADLKILDWRADRVAASALLIHQGDELCRAGLIRDGLAKYELAARQRPDLHYLEKKIASSEQRLQAKSMSPTRAQRVFIDENLEAQSDHVDLKQCKKGAAKADTSSAEMAFPFMMWIDGVGGFLVCPAARNWIGKYVDGTRCQIPVAADISRFHTLIERTHEGYQVSSDGPFHLMRPRGSASAAPLENLILRSGDILCLADRLQLRFLQRERGSSARLTFISAHATVPRCDAILLMQGRIRIADDPEADVKIPGLSGAITIECNPDGRLMAETSDMPLEVDGRSCRGRCRLQMDSRLIGRQVSIQLEPFGWKALG